MEQHSHPFITIGVSLVAGAATGVVSVQDIDIYLAVTLKIISILSFLVGTGYAIWKWRADIKMQRTVDTVMEDYQKKKQKSKKSTK